MAARTTALARALIAVMTVGGVVLVLIIQAALGNPYVSLGALCLACLAGLALAARLPARGAGVTREGGS